MCKPLRQVHIMCLHLLKQNKTAHYGNYFWIQASKFRLVKFFVCISCQWQNTVFVLICKNVICKLRYIITDWNICNNKCDVLHKPKQLLKYLLNLLRNHTIFSCLCDVCWCHCSCFMLTQDLQYSKLFIQLFFSPGWWFWQKLFHFILKLFITC